MKGFVKAFNTTSEYNTFKNSAEFVRPNLSLCKDTHSVQYNPDHFMTIVYKGDGSSPTNIITKNIDYYGTVYTLNESLVSKMTLDGNNITFNDFSVANVANDSTGTCNYYQYTFNDTNEHTLKIWTDSKETLRFSPWLGGPGANSGAWFKSIKKVTIPYGMTSICEDAFYTCSAMTSVTIPDSVTNIGVNAFCSCGSLTTIKLPKALTKINDGLFRDCRGLTSITIPDCVNFIGTYAFSNCTSLPVVNHIRYADTCTVEVDDKTLTTYTIKDGTRFIGDRTFYGCSGLTSINIPEGVVEIGESAFYRCVNLSSITIPNSVMYVGTIAFQYCDSLPVYDNIMYADTCAVSAMNKTLTTYTLKNDTKHICNSVFVSCTNLTDITIPDGVLSIGYSSFQNCSGLTSITIPNSVIIIKEQAFANCSGLTSVTIPDSVTSIERTAFNRCTGLTSCTIGKGVTSIDSYVFNYCNSLTSITCNATTAPSISSATFQNIAQNGTLRVPIGSTGYDTWMQNANYYLGLYNWTKVAQ